MNKKFRKLLSGFVTSVGIMSSVVCPCVQAKWGEGTHAMTDEEFKAFYKKFGRDAFHYSEIHPELKERGSIKQNEYVRTFNEQNNLFNASFSEVMQKYNELYELSLESEDKLSDKAVLVCAAMNYFQSQKIKSAYLRIYETEGEERQDVIIYEGKDGEWFVADIEIFFAISRGIRKKDILAWDVNLAMYGFNPTENLELVLKRPLRDYIKQYASSFRNFILTTENSGNGGFHNCIRGSEDLMLLPQWVKESDACCQSFRDKFLIDDCVEKKDFEKKDSKKALAWIKSEKVKFVSPVKVEIFEESIDGINGLVYYKGVNDSKVSVPLV